MQTFNKIAIAIAKFYFIAAILCFTGYCILQLINYYKLKNAVPPYVVEEKYETPVSSSEKKDYKLILKEAKNEFGEVFEIKVGHLTFNTYEVGDTIFNKIN